MKRLLSFHFIRLFLCLNQLCQCERVANLSLSIGLKRCRGGGCPYMAAWLIHINLFKRLTYYMTSTKMEEASFRVFDAASEKYQLLHPHLYFVHHMSEFEHQLHKKDGLDVSRNLTLAMSRSAYTGECQTYLKFDNFSDEYIGFVPFYGGLPPNVTLDFRVKSIGQGNSLMDPNTKTLQCMATICSCLRYFGYVVVGVARDEDFQLIKQSIDSLPQYAKDRVYIVHLSLQKPAHLPFHLLTWGQQFLQKINCKFNYDNNTFDESLFWICFNKYRNFEYLNVLQMHHPLGQNITKPIKFIYYTESDQILRFENQNVLQALSDAMNTTTFFTGRRKTKDIRSNPESYMESLNQWRECCSDGYILDWPQTNLIHPIQSTTSLSPPTTPYNKNSNSINYSNSSNLYVHKSSRQSKRATQLDFNHSSGAIYDKVKKSGGVGKGRRKERGNNNNSNLKHTKEII